MLLRCPVCKADNSQPGLCRRCKADLTMLFALEQRREEALAWARRCVEAGDWSEARRLARTADHLRRDEESKQMLALTALLCGDFHEARRLHGELTGDEATLDAGGSSTSPKR
jgi:hypothetical protein